MQSDCDGWRALHLSVRESMRFLLKHASGIKICIFHNVDRASNVYRNVPSASPKDLEDPASPASPASP